METVLFLAMWVLLGVGYAFATMQPIYAVKRIVESPASFSMMDVLWLMVLLQWPLIFLSAARRWHNNQVGRVLSVGGLLVLVVAALWLGFTSHLSQLGIRRSNRRGIFLVVVVPVTILGSLTFGPITFLTVRALSLSRTEFATRQQGMLVIAFLVLVGGGILSRLLSHWVAGEAAELKD